MVLGVRFLTFIETPKAFSDAVSHYNNIMHKSRPISVWYHRIHIPSSRIRLQGLGQAHFLYQFHIYIIYCCKLSEAMIGPKFFSSKIKKKIVQNLSPPFKGEINGTKIGSYSKSLKRLQRWTQFFRVEGGWVVSNVIFYLFACIGHHILSLTFD